MFERNIHTYTMREQLKLHNSTVLIAGCGGGGCSVAEILARTGVGKIIIYDGDVFEESNCNRQLGATKETVGEPKVFVIKKRLESLGCNIDAHFDFFNKDSILPEADMICDCVDGVKNKKMFGKLCKDQSRVYVTGGLGNYTYWSAVLKDKSINDILRDNSGPSYPCCSGVFGQASLEAQIAIDCILKRDLNIKDKLILYNQRTFTTSVEDI